MKSSRTVVFQALLNIFGSLHKALILNKFLGKSSLQELAEFGERRFAEQEVAGSNPGQTNAQGL